MFASMDWMCLCVCVCVEGGGGGLLSYSAGWALSFLNVLDNEQMLQKLGKKCGLLPAVPLWPAELAHWHGTARPAATARPLRSSRCCRHCWCWGTLRDLARPPSPPSSQPASQTSSSLLLLFSSPLLSSPEEGVNGCPLPPLHTQLWRSSARFPVETDRKSQACLQRPRAVMHVLSGNHKRCIFLWPCLLASLSLHEANI